jgi:purine-nucleoside/S-methyl-5'-thioadenosine phosphorylase / adenosine deaminase
VTRGGGVDHGIQFLVPDWPAPPRVRAAVTSRVGGVSRGPYASLNLGDHVGDAPQAVAENRARLEAALGLPAAPLWLRQVHGCGVARHGRDAVGCAADAAVALGPGRVCAVLTADCLPVLLCDRAGTRVAAVHAGWRGLLEGVIESALDALDGPAAQLLAWLGPAIGPEAFEVGGEVREAFLARDGGSMEAFRPSPGGRWLADIYALARRRLAQSGVGYVGGGGCCTVGDPARFFSYRRDGETGRMASLIWLA